MTLDMHVLSLLLFVRLHTGMYRFVQVVILVPVPEILFELLANRILVDTIPVIQIIDRSRAKHEEETG